MAKGAGISEKLDFGDLDRLISNLGCFDVSILLFAKFLSVT